MAAYYKIISCANENLALQVNLTPEQDISQIISGQTSVNLQPYSDVHSQMWYIDDFNSTAAQSIRTRTNLVFMLNAQNPAASSSACNVYTENSNTKIKIVPVTSGSGTYRLQLNSTSNRYLTITGTTAGSGVNWQGLNDVANAQKWKFLKLGNSPYPTYPANYTYEYITSGNVPFYLITVDATKIGVVNVMEQGIGIPVPYCGCNGGFFDPGYGTHGSHNIALNFGVPVGPAFVNADGINKIAGDYNSVGSWNIAYYAGKIKFVKATSAAALISALGGAPTWAQGGVSLDFGNKNWAQNWETPTYGVDSKSPGRTMLVANTSTNKVYLFVQQTGNNNIQYSIRDFRETIQQYLGIPESGTTNFVGLMLDGGSSSGLRCYNSTGTRMGKDSGRALCQIIYIKT